MSSTLHSRSKPFRLVLDHAELLDNPECLDAVADLAARLPENSQLAIATRGRPPVPLHRGRRPVVRRQLRRHRGEQRGLRLKHGHDRRERPARLRRRVHARELSVREPDGQYALWRSRAPLDLA